MQAAIHERHSPHRPTASHHMRVPLGHVVRPSHPAEEMSYLGFYLEGSKPIIHRK